MLHDVQRWAFNRASRRLGEASGRVEDPSRQGRRTPSDEGAQGTCSHGRLGGSQRLLQGDRRPACWGRAYGASDNRVTSWSGGALRVVIQPTRPSVPLGRPGGVRQHRKVVGGPCARLGKWPGSSEATSVTSCRTPGGPTMHSHRVPSVVCLSGLLNDLRHSAASRRTRTSAHGSR
jgi:hypothetical protein